MANTDKITKEWVLFPSVDNDLNMGRPDLNTIVRQLLFNRGIVNGDDIDTFLNPNFEKDMVDPFMFNDMDKAVDLIISHIKKQDKIVVYGDYDADGVTSSAILIELLTLLKAKVDVYIPDRVREGYGINKKSLDEINSWDTKLIITVDNGIRNRKEVDYAISLGMDVIITDHHMPPENDLPKCLIINPRLTQEKYSFKDLAGVGVAFKLAQGIIAKAKLDDDIKKEILKRCLDLVAIGTIADCVNLVGENRLYTKLGLEVLNQNRRVGINELMTIARLNDQVSAWHVGWLLAPRINAAGRIEHANKAYNLLLTKDAKEARSIAQSLDVNNSDRQKITDDIVDEIESQIGDIKKEKIIVAISPGISNNGKNWNEGVVGLAASRICDKYYLPTLVITANDDEIKGSGRSIEEFHITKALEKATEFLHKFGGHSAACGFTVKDKDALAGFADFMRKIAREQLSGFDLKPKIKIEAQIDLSDIDDDLMEELDKFEPFGESNQRPKFVSRNVQIIDIINMGNDAQHIKLRLKQNGSRLINAIGFGQSQHWTDLKIGDNIDIVYYVEKNKFNGRTETQLKIIDIKKI